MNKLMPKTHNSVAEQEDSKEGGFFNKRNQQRHGSFRAPPGTDNKMNATALSPGRRNTANIKAMDHGSDGGG